jgi:DNA invertase Pin-like site-specific DNA recombinase
MTKQPKRMDGYVRVSRVAGREGPGYISPSVQREAVQKWADYRGVEIVRWHQDEDQSGGTQDRPGLREAIARVEAGETEGIACAKLNRFARNVSAAIDDVRRIEAAGGSLAFVQEDIDPTGPFGSFILTVLLAVATLERDNLVESWNVAKERSIERGAKIGPTPFGYVRADAGLIEPDPVYGPVVTEAFRRAADDGIPAALDYLLEHGNGRTWSAFTVRRMLRNRSYLGEQRYGTLSNTTAHPALVKRDVFERAQSGDETPKRRTALPYPLSGLATCATCGEVMVAGGSNRPDGSRVRTYRCRASLASWKGAKCSAPVSIVANRLEEYVLGQIREAYTTAQQSARLVSDDGQGLDELQSQLEAAESERDRFASDPTAAELLGELAWTKALRARADRATAAQSAYRTAAETSRRTVLTIPVDQLDELPPADLGVVFAAVLADVIVTKSKLSNGRSPLPDRVRVVFHADLHAKLAAQD